MTRSRSARRALVTTAAIALVVFGGACGGDGDESAAEELARQNEIAAARRDAAREAREAERVRSLQREVAQLKEQAQSPVPQQKAAVETQASEPAAEAPVDDWPGGTAYTAVLGSHTNESEARQRQAEASGRGLDAGVLFSSDYGSLRPGYWVVFSGSFGSVDEAGERVARARELGYSDAYPRFVAP